MHPSPLKRMPGSHISSEHTDLVGSFPWEAQGTIERSRDKLMYASKGMTPVAQGHKLELTYHKHESGMTEAELLFAVRDGSKCKVILLAKPGWGHDEGPGSMSGGGPPR